MWTVTGLSKACHWQFANAKVRAAMRDKKNTGRCPALRAVRPNADRRLWRLGCGVLIHAPLDLAHGRLDDHRPVGVVERGCTGGERCVALELERIDIDGVVPPILSNAVRKAGEPQTILRTAKHGSIPSAMA